MYHLTYLPVPTVLLSPSSPHPAPSCPLLRLERRTGMPKLRIEECAARKQARLDAGVDVVVGDELALDLREDHCLSACVRAAVQSSLSPVPASDTVSMP